ncbi:uncharacterized protein DSM5745_09418 [Aspergillus mulundensis]|uniref:Uncharacterized protein n=1 Tax=Aspergillus mulundensis TaxID=1810919 RepID=A0A3D8QV82_9EURO|nr:hypothetical protein DSM5745_09418 [Aspergillus mulundensis]RDW65679.1 hypothetical protein DSM5745_09418 [Aspergillus mulundensis]
MSSFGRRIGGSSRRRGVNNAHMMETDDDLQTRTARSNAPSPKVRAHLRHWPAHLPRLPAHDPAIERVPAWKKSRNDEETSKRAAASQATSNAQHRTVKRDQNTQRRRAATQTQSAPIPVPALLTTNTASSTSHTIADLQKDLVRTVNSEKAALAELRAHLLELQRCSNRPADASEALISSAEHSRAEVADLRETVRGLRSEIARLKFDEDVLRDTMATSEREMVALVSEIDALRAIATATGFGPEDCAALDAFKMSTQVVITRLKNSNRRLVRAMRRLRRTCSEREDARLEVEGLRAAQRCEGEDLKREIELLRVEITVLHHAGSGGSRPTAI